MKLSKVLIAVIVAVLICIPGMIALSYYSNAQNNPITVQAISSLKLTTPDGVEYTYKKGDVCAEPSLGEDLIAYFVGLNDRAVFVSELPEHATEKNRYTVTYTSYNRETTYHYFFTTDSKYAYMVDHNKTVYRITEADAVNFLKSSFSYSLYTSSATPVFKVGQTVITPATMLWQYPCYDDEYRTVPVYTTDEIVEVTVRGGLETLFDNVPDYTNISISSGNVSLYDGQPDTIPSSLFQDNAYYTVKLQSRWFRDETSRDSFGEATYQFNVKVMAPAVFYLSHTEIDPGEFVVISGKNVEDPSKISFVSTPSIQFTPTFFTDGEYVRALIPAGIALEEMPQYFTFHVSYEGTEQDMQLNIKDKTFRSQSYDASATLIATNRSHAALDEFSTVLGPILNTGSDTRFFDNSTFANPGGDAEIRTGFGLYRTLTATGEVYRHEGVDYVIYGDSHTALSTMKGKVVYTGKLALTGNVVIIDHGFGLHSLYAHLDSISVSVGDTLDKGDEIGICGSTGFTKDTNLHFGLYVYDVPVSPYSVLDYGMQMTNYQGAQT